MKFVHVKTTSRYKNILFLTIAFNICQILWTLLFLRVWAKDPAFKCILDMTLAPAEVESKFPVLEIAVSLHVLESGPIFFFFLGILVNDPTFSSST